MGNRSAWIYEEAVLCGGKKFRNGTSDYINKFRQGAVLFPLINTD
jgi:uncharacterized membrane protein YgcG